MPLIPNPLRRIPAYRWHAQQKAIFKTISESETPAHYGQDALTEAKVARQLAAIDLCAFPRCGFKGPGTVEWLKTQGIVVPNECNQALRQSDDCLVLRCGSTDIVIAGDITLRSNRPAELKSAHAQSSQQQRGYDALREEGYTWFMLIGEQTPDLLARLCEVDMRPHVFADLAIAQTRLAGLSVIAARCDFATLYAMHLFFDTASSVYFCETLSELLESFNGRFVGHECLLTLLGHRLPSTLA